MKKIIRIKSILFGIKCLALIFGITLLLSVGSVYSMDKPAPGEIEKYKKDNTYGDRTAFAQNLRNYEIHPDLIARKNAEIKALGEGKQFDRESLPYTTGLPSVGSPNVFLLLIDFPDNVHVNSQADINNRMFGDGNAADYPYESFRKYYQRASYNNLNIQGTVFQWYRAANNRSYYTNSKDLIKEALNSLDPSTDFSIFDNNGDGKIDYFAVVWAGPHEGWSSLWWAWCDIYGNNFGSDTYSVDGKTLGVYSWQFEAVTVGDPFSPNTICHETGHALGLPDYYDYDCCDGDGKNEGANNGLGGLDMMDGNWGDHNAFSKWLLGWLTPTVVSDINVIHKINLRPSSLYPDAVMIMPGASLTSPFTEYFIVQNRAKYANDTPYPAEGYTIFHINAFLNSQNNNFKYNNSYTSLKLIRLMEADGLEEIDQWIGANAGDFYTNISSFSRSTHPNSDSYYYNSGYDTGVYVTGISSNTYDRNAIFIIDNDYNFSSLNTVLDNNDLPFTTGGDSIWYGLSIPTYTFNNNAARSALISNNENTWIKATTDKQGILSFYWKTSSEANHDYLKFLIDGVEKDKISGAVDWTEKSYSMSKTGIHTMEWQFARDVSGDGGENRAYLDYVQFTPYTITLEEAVDNSTLTWTAGGNSGWYGYSSASYNGSDAAKSDVIGDNQSAWMSTEVPSAGTLTFNWAVSSEINYDFLELYIDGVRQDRISGLKSVAEKSLFIKGTGNHYILFRYVKDINGKAGNDCGIVDNVRFVATKDLNEAVDNLSLEFETGGDGNWYYQTDESFFGHDAARTPAMTDNKSSFFQTYVSTPGSLSFVWKVSSQQTYDLLKFKINGVETYAISGEQDWQQKTNIYISSPGILRWEYVKNSSITSGSDCGWVDRIQFTPTLTLGNGADSNGLEWTREGELNWINQTAVYHTGNDALQCGPHPEPTTYSKKSGTVKTTVTGPGDLSYYCKTSTEGSYTPIKFSIDDVKIDSIGGITDWAQKTFHIENGTHELSWTFETYGEIYGGCTDQVWLDEVVFAQNVSIPEGVDNYDYTWETISDGLWHGETELTAFGGDAVRSGAIADNQWSILDTTITGPATLTFYWKCSTEQDKDECEFYLDNVFKKQISGETAWTKESYLVGAGSHTLRWWYLKDASGSAGSDAAWIDRLVVESTPSLMEALDNPPITINTDGNAVWFGQKLDSYYGGDAGRSGDITDNQYSRMYATITGPGLLTFFWKVSSQGYWDYLYFYLDGQARNKIAGQIDWQQRTYIIPDGSHTIEWKYVKDNSFSDYNDCGWVDKIEYTPGTVAPCALTVPIDYPTIQEAIDNAREDCTITVLPGTYYENIRIIDKNVVLTSTDPTNKEIVERTIIDGNDSGSCITFGGTEYYTSKVAGFKLMNGRSDYGAGVAGNGTLASLEGNIITSNTAVLAGGAVHWVNGAIERNEIHHNYSLLYAAGIFRTSGNIINNLVYNNSATAECGALGWCNGNVFNNTIYGNTSGVNGGGIFSSSGVIRNNIVWNNYAPTNPEVFDTIEPQYCCIKNWTGGGTGNITTEPQFISTPSIIPPPFKNDNLPKGGFTYNFHLKNTSPCIDAGGTVSIVPKDVDFENRPYNGTRIPRGDASDYDIGADEYTRSVPEIILLTPSQMFEWVINSYSITWIDYDPDNNAQISLYYDMDNSGNNGTLITDKLTEDDNADKYSWNISSVPEGTYFVYAKITDGITGDVFAYAPGGVKISHVTKDDLTFHLLGVAPLPSYRLPYANFNGDTVVDIADLIYLMSL